MPARMQLGYILHNPNNVTDTCTRTEQGTSMTEQLASDRPNVSSRPGMSHFTAIALLSSSFLISLIISFTVDEAARSSWVAESGPVETLTIGLHLLGASVLLLSALFLGDRTFAWRWAFILGLFAAREADWHKKFTTEGIFRSSYYVRSEAPIMERVVVGLAMLLIAYVVLSFVFGNLGRLLGAIRSRTRWAMFGLVGILLLISGKSLDAMTWITRAIGTDWRPQIATVNLFEEVTEMTGALLICVAVLCYTHWRVEANRQDSLATER